MTGAGLDKSSPVPKPTEAPAPAVRPSHSSWLLCYAFKLAHWGNAIGKRLLCLYAALNISSKQTCCLPVQPEQDPPLANPKSVGYLPVSVHGDELHRLLPDVKQYGEKLRPQAPFFGVATSSDGGRRLLRAQPDIKQTAAPGDLWLPQPSGSWMTFALSFKQFISRL